MSQIMFHVGDFDVMNQIMLRTGVELDQSTTLCSYLMFLRYYGKNAFRIVHSHGTYIMVVRELAEFGIDVKSMPDYTQYSDMLKGVQLHREGLEKATDKWGYLMAIKRRGERLYAFVDDEG